ncbi:MAG: DNA-formamidopyrimidine glycosylase family protein [Gemmatimonadota bacterium]
MPELPDITVYVEALEERLRGQALENVRIRTPFLLRSVDPPISAVVGKRVTEVARIGKRIAIGFEDDLWLVIHLMIAGRFHWKAAGAKVASKVDLAAFDFPTGTLTLTEAGSKRRASLHVARTADLPTFARGGLDVMAASQAEFAERLRSESHTVKRALTDPRLFDGIGNAFSDEILHAARLSPMVLTRRMADEGVARLYDAARSTLRMWTDLLRTQRASGFPEKVTAFRPEMAVHGKFKQPCPVCRTPVQRIRYADNETNYCARCQTGGRLLADRAMSRLLKDDWPRSIDELD